jgi:uncharacterized protein (DUF2062 family)
MLYLFSNAGYRMIKKILHKILPKPKDIQRRAYLRIFGKLLLDPRLWQLNVQSVALAVAVALFCGFIPFPTQAIIAIFVALIVRANIPVTGIMIWYSNPFTMPAMFYFAYKVGASVLGLPSKHIKIELSLSWLQSQLVLIGKPLLLGSLICGSILAIGGYALVWGAHGLVRWYRIHRATKHHHKLKNFVHLNK